MTVFFFFNFSTKRPNPNRVKTHKTQGGPPYRAAVVIPSRTVTAVVVVVFSITYSITGVETQCNDNDNYNDDNNGK